MKLEAKQRLLSEPWCLEAMPQVDLEETHQSRWFEDFHMLTKSGHLFDYNGHEVWGYRYKQEPNAVFFVCLLEGTPVYINEVHNITLSFDRNAEGVKHALHGYEVWMQSSVAFSEHADRSKLKGLATKIFWDYLATGKNVAVTDSQQTASGAALWRKLLKSGGGYLTAVLSNYGNDRMHIASGDSRWEDGTHFQYSAKNYWKESDEGKYLRVFIKRDLK